MERKILELSRTYAALLVAAAYIAFTYAAASAPAKVEVIVDGKKKVVETDKVVVRDILRENRIAVGSRDIIYPDPGSTVAENGSRITIKKARRIILSYRGFKEEVYSYSPDPALELVRAGYSPKSSYIAYTPKTLSGYDVIRIERLRNVKEERMVYFDSNGKTISASNKEALKFAGLRKIVVLKRYAGDRLLASIIVQDSVLKKPVERKAYAVARSAKRSSRGEIKRFNASDGKYLTMVATAYAPGAGAGTITATGRRAGYGIVAVDPRVIPLGTKLYIPGYGYAVAADTGGAIKGYKIDLCFNTASEAIKWGRRKVKVYIVR
jgi:3D (Asp-Asp-Asp) domain-containing protein